MDALDILNSLTHGVNNKVNSENNDNDDIEYIVNTSLRGKSKKEENKNNLTEIKKVEHKSEDKNQIKLNQSKNPFKRKNINVPNVVNMTDELSPIELVSENESNKDKEIIQSFDTDEEIIEESFDNAVLDEVDEVGEVDEIV